MATVTSLVLLSIGCTCAQENPFDSDRASTSSREPARTLAEPEIAPGTSQTAGLLIRSVRQSDPQSPLELAKAVKVMLDVRQFDFAKYYLSRLMASDVPENEQAELVREMGSDFFFTIHATDELAPEGREFSRRMMAANRQFQESPEQIQSLIAKLNDSNIAIRSRAFRSLRRLGPPAVASLIEIFSDRDRKGIYPGVRGALRKMGEQAIPLLRGASVAEDAAVRSESLQALAHYRGEGVADILSAVVFSSMEQPSIRAAIAQAMRDQKYGLPTRSSLISRLERRANLLLTGKETVRGTLAPSIEVWRWDVATKTLQPSMVTVATASRYEAARLARELHAIEPQSNELRKLYLLTQLEVAKRAVGTQGEQSVVSEDFFKSLIPSIGSVPPTEINRLLESAVANKTIPAAIACCELLAEQKASEGLGVFHSASGKMPAVIQAMMLGDRHLQHAALKVIDRLDPANAYPGSSLPVKLAVYLANTYQRSVGLVGHHKLEVAQTIAGSLPMAGLIGESAASSRNLFELAARNPDVSLILVSDTLVAPRFDELIRQLRSDFRTARIPIGLMLRDHTQSRAVSRLVESDGLTYAFPDGIDAEPLAAHVNRVSRLADADLSFLSDADRYRHATAAASWLAKVSTDRQRFGFYQLGSYQDQLVGLLYRPGLDEVGCQILANLGTPMAQRELANFASQKSVAPQRRRFAADSLRQAFEKGSILLTRDQIRQQYDRYNASEQDRKENQAILGSILDSIEQRGSTRR